MEKAYNFTKQVSTFALCCIINLLNHENRLL